MRRMLVLVSVAVACAHRSETASPDLRSFDQAVYQTVLDSVVVPWASSGIRQLVIRDRTSVHRQVAGSFERFYRLPQVDSAAVRGLEARSREPHPLTGLRSLKLRIPIVLVDDQTLNAFPKDLDQYWSQFYQRYPGSSGLISLSSIGYNSKSDFAILMMYQECGVMCGNGYIAALRRVGETWGIVAIEGTPVS